MDFALGFPLTVPVTWLSMAGPPFSYLLNRDDNTNLTGLLQKLVVAYMNAKSEWHSREGGKASL